jgi:tetratricopeptide repeat protein 21B
MFSFYFVQELRPKPGDIRGKILENVALTATKGKANVEKAIASLMELCSNEVRH